MPLYHGEMQSKIDEKGRVLLPALFKRQMPSEDYSTYMVKKGYEGCIELYPQFVWDSVEKEIAKLNPHVKADRQFKRRFLLGVQHLDLDKAGRLTLPKRLLEFAGIEKDLVFFAHSYFIEIWNPDKLNDLDNEMTDDEYSDQAQRVMGNINLFND